MPPMREAFPVFLGLALLSTSSAAAHEVRLTVPSAPVAWDAYPLATGVPIPRGELASPAGARLLDYTGQEVPIQASALARWPDESVKSLLVQFIGPLNASRAKYYVLEYGKDVVATAASPSRVKVQETAGEVTVTTGALDLRIGKRPFGFTACRRASPQAPCESLLSRPADLFAVNAFDGQEYRASLDPAPSVIVEESGPIRAVVRASGSLRSAGGRTLIAFIVRLRAFAGQDLVEADVTVVDPRPEADVAARRPQLALSISSYGLELPYALGAASWSFGGQGDGVHSGPVRPGVEAYLLQSGRLNYDMTNGTLQPFTFAYEGAARGAKASGWVDVSDASRGLAVCLRNFWQQFPKEWSVADNILRVYFHPQKSSRPAPDLTYPRLAAATGYARPNTFYSPREGLAKTYELLISFHSGDRAAARPEALNRAFQSSPLPTAPAALYATSGVYGRIIDAGPWSAGHDDWLMRQIFEPSIQAFKDQGGLAVQYGWRDFGDRMRGGWCEVDPAGFKIPCFYNDTHLGAHVWFVQYLRTLDPRWRDYAWNATRFFMDIGVSHSPRRGYWPKAYGPGEGYLIRHEIVDHTCRNLHRGHAHLSALADLYLLTGDRRALEVMREIGDWWVSAVPDFFPTPIKGPHYAEAERDFAWPLFVLNEAYRGTGDPRYLRAGAQIVKHLLEWWQTPSDHLVAGKVVGRNDWTRGTGWWAMFPRCDNCPEGYNGTNPWMAGALLSNLIYFYEYDKDRSFADGALVKEMLLQTMNYVVKYGWNPTRKCFRYSEAQPDSCGDDTLVYFPLAYLSRLQTTAASPARYDTAPRWIEIAKGARKDWSEVRWRGATNSGFYGYEIAFMPEFFREMTEREAGPRR
jgi:hypothetical protein